jgi:hypothetical protein
LIEVDVEVVIHALKMFGARYSIASMQALRAEHYRRSTSDDIAMLRTVCEADDEGASGTVDPSANTVP